MTRNFSNSHALVLGKAGKVVVKFEKSGGLFVTQVWLIRPEVFVGQASQ